MRFVYLHGFASGPGSRKAQAFRIALEKQGAELEIPDLARGDFEHLTISGQLALMERIIADQPVRLIGSSMGGYLAALYASTHPAVERMVLLAPAFGFTIRWEELLGREKLAAWKDSGLTEVYHYGDKALRSLRYDLYEDSQRHAVSPDFPQPTEIFHGIHDGVVPIDLSRQFTTTHPDTVLNEVDSDHELVNVLDQIVVRSVPFLLAD